MHNKYYNHTHESMAEARRNFITSALITLVPKYDCLINVGASYKREYVIYDNFPTLIIGPNNSAADITSNQEYIKN